MSRSGKDEGEEAVCMGVPNEGSLEEWVRGARMLEAW